MKALTKGHYRGSDGTWAVFDLEWGAELRVGILEPDIGRVVLRRDGAYRLDRSWSIAPGGLEPAFEGRHRDSTEGFSCPGCSVSEQDGRVTLAGSGLSAVVTLSPFGIAWHRAGESRPFLQDRRNPGLLRVPEIRSRPALHGTRRQGPALRRRRQGGTSRPHGPALQDRRGRSLRVRRGTERSALQDDPVRDRRRPGGAHGVFYDTWRWARWISAPPSTTTMACSGRTRRRMAISTSM